MKQGENNCRDEDGNGGRVSGRKTVQKNAAKQNLFKYRGNKQRGDNEPKRFVSVSVQCSPKDGIERDDQDIMGEDDSK